MRKDFYANNIGHLYSSYTKFADTRFACCNTAGSTVFYTIVNAKRYTILLNLFSSGGNKKYFTRIGINLLLRPKNVPS